MVTGHFYWKVAAAIVILAAAALAGIYCFRDGEPADSPSKANPHDTAYSGPDLYREVAKDAGIDFIYRNGEEAGHYAILESLGGGVALLDYDGDDLLDLFVTGGGYFAGNDKNEIKGYPCKLYKNLGNWKFKDVTAEVGVENLAGKQPWFYSHGCAACDYDRDGWTDLLVTGYGRLALFRNEPVDPNDASKGRRLVDVTSETGLIRDHFWSTSAAWGDLDSDGWPDLYVCQYVDWSFANNPRCAGYTTDVKRDVCPPGQFSSTPHALYHNVADAHGRRFVDASREAGLRLPPREDKDYGKGLGVIMVDVNRDRKPDIYVANDTTDNFLYLNESTPGKLAFREMGFALGVARDNMGIPNGSMGVDAGDYNASGWPSLWVTNYEGELHALYRSKPGKQVFFQFSTHVGGIAAIGQNFVGFGTAFVDVDRDGWEDLVVTNGHVIRHPYRCGVRQKPVLLRNLGDGRFADITPHGGTYFKNEHCGRGLAVGDLDNDGKPDLVISHVNAPLAVLRNVSPDERWLGVQLVGRERRDVVGARLILEMGDRRFTRFAKGGGSYLSSGDRRHLICLGSSGQSGRLTVEWPSGEPSVQQFDGLAPGSYHRLVQDDLATKALPAR